MSLPAIQDEIPSRLRRNGVYLITGGLGGMGLVLAQWLAETVQARLVLTARTPLPPRESWQKWLVEHAEEHATSRKIRAVQSLEAAGATVLVCEADVCDEPRMRRVVELAEQQSGPICGVVHAAGISDRGLAQLKTQSMAEKVFAAKVDGFRVLERVLGARPLDFLIVCSSIASISGGIAQVDYSAANAFLDAVAWQNRLAGGPLTIAINWNTWNEAGMSVETAMPASLKELGHRLGMEDSVSNQEGVDAFRRIVARCQEPQVAVSLIDLPAFLLRQQQSGWREEMSQLEQSAPAVHPRPDVQTPYVEPVTDTERIVAEIWQGLFGFQPIGRHDDFFELGGHSLMALQLLDKLRVRFGVNLTLAHLFEQRTIEDLCRRIDAVQWASHEGAPADDHEREAITL
jgi:NAD(P)-dependent dehydrogenase (short-subunit alcohol dehydrogenase family)/acyl carrier protein